MKAHLAWMGALALAVLPSACDPSDTAEDDDGGDASSSATLSEACLASCGVRVECGQTTGSCSSVCDAVQDAYTGTSCVNAAASAFECEAELSCGEFEDYIEDFRGSACGDAYAVLAEACGYEAMPPDQCEAFCARAEQCAPELTVGGCADNCNIMLGTFERQQGAECARAQALTFDCYRAIECSEMEALLRGEAQPAECVPQLDSALELCQ